MLCVVCSGISLGNNGLVGTVPSALSVLTALDTLWLFDNQLSGTLPDIFGALPRLR